MTDVFGYSETDTRRISETVSRVLGTQSTDTQPPRSSDAQLAVVTKPIDVLRELKWMTSTFDVTMHTIDGAAWKDENTAEPIRLISNGLQIAAPIAGVGLCVRDDAFWAVNIGSLAAPTITVSGTPKLITGASTSGKAAVLEVTEDGDLRVTTKRLRFVRRDDGGTIADGTLIQLAYVSGSLTIVHANCGPKAGLTGLPADPEE
jgi:hypothetical protein